MAEKYRLNVANISYALKRIWRRKWQYGCGLGNNVKALAYQSEAGGIKWLQWQLALKAAYQHLRSTARERRSGTKSNTNEIRVKACKRNRRNRLSARREGMARNDVRNVGDENQ